MSHLTMTSLDGPVYAAEDQDEMIRAVTGHMQLQDMCSYSI